MQQITEALATPTAGYLGLGTAAAVSVASAVYLLTRPSPLNLGLDYSNQSVKMEDGSYASLWTGKHGQLMEYLYDDAKTVYESFLRGRRITGDGKFLGARTGPNREYEWLSYNQVYDRVRAFGSGLIKTGVKPGQTTNFGIFAQNRLEWMMTDLACQMFSMVTVALYDTLGSEAVVYIVKLCEIGTVVCDIGARAQLLIDYRSQTPSLTTIIMVEEISPQLRQQAEKAGLKLLAFSEVEELGKTDLQDPIPPEPSDLCTICFTSGTTGDPKGVMLTHRNMMANTGAIVERINGIHHFTSDDTHLSYLPLAHAYERYNMMCQMLHGGHAGFYSRDIALLFDDFQALRPTQFTAVPRLLNKVRDKVMTGVQGSKIKSFLLNLAFKNKLAEVRRGIIRRNSIWDKLVFHKIQALLGGRIKFLCVSSAPLSGEVFDFARCAFGCLVMEGYGQTEVTAGCTVQLPGDPDPGHVGSPIACNYIKLIDVPEMDYHAKNGIGEVCVKGTNVTSGYYRNPEKTRELFTSDGWLRTGDVGIIRKNGTLQIIDRCKHIFKLSQGEYLAPEKIESVYTRSMYVQQCFVDGDSFKSRCVAVVVPDPDVVLAWAADNKRPKDLKQLCQDEEFRHLVLQDMLAVGKTAGLKGFEQVLDIALEPEPFSVEAGLLTPTFKSKRTQLRRYFAHKVAATYAKHKD